MSDERIARDLTRKICEQFQEQLSREMRIAQIMLQPPELSRMMLGIAGGISVAAILYTLQLRRTDVDPATFFDLINIQLYERIAQEKPDALTELAKTEARRA